MALTRKEIVVFIGIVVLFFALRLPGLHIPYHQDEYKWPLYAEAIVYEPGSVPHPPLTEFIYVKGGNFVGLENFRYIPLFFATINLFLLFYLVGTLFDKKTALWSMFLFAFSFFSVLASLMVDVDGAVMPFFFLLTAIGYFKLKQSEWKNWNWATLLVACAISGFLIKVVFVLPLAAFVLDFAIEKQVFGDRRKLLKYAFWVLGGIGALILVLIGIKFIFPFFNLSKAVTYWEHFIVFSGRGWFQTGIQFAKSILYTSPLLILPAFLITKEIWQKTRVFFFYIAFGLFFYLIAFDFSLGALDRYMQFLVVPLCIIVGAIFVKELNLRERNWTGIIFLAYSGLVFALQFLHHVVPPQHPKAEWLTRIISFKWNFLFPFTGGSGPTGFYVSFAFMALVWILSVILLVSVFRNKSVRSQVLIGIFMLGLSYNAVFAEEYLYGKINGSPYAIFQNLKAFIIGDFAVRQTIVYNDIGGWEIQRTGKYFRRLYANPEFEPTYRPIFETYKGYLLYIDIPKMPAEGLYADYIKTCTNIYEERSGQITAILYKCGE